MLEQRVSLSKKKRIKYYHSEPDGKPDLTAFFLPGIHTSGTLYPQYLQPFEERGERIIVPMPHEGHHPITSIEQNAALVMSLYRRLHMTEHKNGWFATPHTLDFTRHVMMGYSLGALTALALAADEHDDHVRTEHAVCVSSPAPGQDYTFQDYSDRFLDMAKRLADGSEGDTGKRFARVHGPGFVWNALRNYTRTVSLLESINAFSLPKKSVNVPVTLILSGNDEFFEPEYVIDFYDRVCRNLDVHVLEGVSHARILHQPGEIAAISLGSYGRERRARPDSNRSFGVRSPA